MRKVSARLVAMTEGKITYRLNFCWFCERSSLPQSKPKALPAPPSGGAKERTVVALPSSDEEGVSATCRDDGRRDNVPIEFLLVLRKKLSPSVKAKGFASSPIRWSRGTGLLRTCGMSMKALNLWAFMRGFEVRNNRTETKNSCLLNLWRQEFVLFSTAVTGRGHCPLSIWWCTWRIPSRSCRTWSAPCTMLRRGNPCGFRRGRKRNCPWTGW